VYFEIHRVGEFTARSLDIDVVLDLMIHDLDIVQWLVGEDVEVTELHASVFPYSQTKWTRRTRGSSFDRRRGQHHGVSRGHGKDSQNAFLPAA
jgi:predicted dehydrogenase